MTAHLTDTEIRDFATGALPAEDLLRADEHLSACERCRRHAGALGHAAQAVEDFERGLRPPATHVSEEDLQRYVQRRLPADEAFAVRQHLRACALCASQLNDLRSWADPGPRRGLRLGWLALAAAVLVAVLTPLAVWQIRSGRLAQPSSLVGLDHLAPLEQARVRESLEAGVVSLPSFVADLQGSREVMLGPSRPSPTFNLVSPVGTAAPDDRPVFEWQPLPGAEDYVVEVFDEQGTPVASARSVRDTTWMPTTALPRARNVVWQVTGRRADGTVTAPAPPAPPARFRVLDAASAETLRRSETAHPGSHLLLGILNMQFGVVDRARWHFERVAADDPHADVARRSLKRLPKPGTTSP